MARALVPTLLLILTPLAGCRTVVPAPQGEVDRDLVYQRIANALPRASFGWGQPPGIATMAKSAKEEAPPPAIKQPFANERGVQVVVHVYRPRNEWIPYAAMGETSYEWKTFPNVLLAPLIVVPFQIVRATVVIDTTRVEGLRARLDADIHRLKSISKEIGMGGPWSHAVTVENKILWDESNHGKGKLALHFDYLIPVPAWFPRGGPAADTAAAFAWAAANPEAPVLPDAPPEKKEGVKKGEQPKKEQPAPEPAKAKDG